MQKYLWYCFMFALLLPACSNGKLHTDRQQEVFYEITEHRDGDYFAIDSLTLEDNARRNGLSGILLRFKLVDENEGFLATLMSDGPPESYQLALYAYNADMQPVMPHRFAWDTLMTDTACFYNESCRYAPEKPMEIFIPYGMLSVPAGEQDAYFVLSGQSDSFQHAKAGSRPVEDLSVKIHLHYIQPPVLKTRLTVYGFGLNGDSVDVQSFDYHVTGTGYPDLYWELYQGNEIVYTSKILHNSILYSAASTTPELYVTPDDSLVLKIWDYDDLSKHDFIGQLPLNYSALNTSPSGGISFGKIKQLRLKLEKL